MNEEKMSVFDKVDEVWQIQEKEQNLIEMRREKCEIARRNVELMNKISSNIGSNLWERHKETIHKIVETNLKELVNDNEKHTPKIARFTGEDGTPQIRISIPEYSVIYVNGDIETKKIIN